MKIFEWKCVNKDNEKRIVVIWAKDYSTAYSKICDYCDKKGLVPLEYLGYEEEVK